MDVMCTWGCDGMNDTKSDHGSKKMRFVREEVKGAKLEVEGKDGRTSTNHVNVDVGLDLGEFGRLILLEIVHIECRPNQT